MKGKKLIRIGDRWAIRLQWKRKYMGFWNGSFKPSWFNGKWCISVGLGPIAIYAGDPKEVRDRLRYEKRNKYCECPYGGSHEYMENGRCERCGEPEKGRKKVLTIYY